MPSYTVRPPISSSAKEQLKFFADLPAHLLFYRGLTDSTAAQAFLSPNYEAHRYDPFLMRDMEVAVARVAKAIADNEHIVIYSDYDADGVPGGVILHDLFCKIGYTNFENYIPDRHHEGFGLNHTAIDSFVASGTKLLITVDCGIADREELKRAKKHGIDVIVTDHHLPPDGKLPLAVAVLDPKRPDCTYPDKNLCGSGVAFKFVEAFLARHGETFHVPVGYEKWLLDMVGLATLSDMVPLVGENRVFASFGMMVLRKTRRPGLRKLLELLKMDVAHLTEDDIAFMITPRINAASRLGEAGDAFRLLATKDEVEAGALAARLDALNGERKGLVATLVKEVKRQMKNRTQESPVLVMGNPDWRPSLLGLVANTLVEEHHVPVFLWGRDGDGVLKGSCRAPEGMNVVVLMRLAGDVFEESGGHACSGGFRVAQEKVHLLPQALERAYQEGSDKPDEADVLFVERVMTMEDVSRATFASILPFAPFGMGNAKPLFLFKSVQVAEARKFGKSNAHLSLSFAKKNGDMVQAIAFFADKNGFSRPPEIGATIDLIASFEQSFFRGREELRLRIVDIV